MHFTNPWHHHQSMHITSPATKTKEQAHPPECNALYKTLGTTNTTWWSPILQQYHHSNKNKGTLPPSACMTHFFKSPVFSVDENILNVNSCHQNHLGVVTITRKLVKMTLVLLLSLDLVCFIIFTWQTGTCYRTWSQRFPGYQRMWAWESSQREEWVFWNRSEASMQGNNTWGNIMSPSVCSSLGQNSFFSSSCASCRSQLPDMISRFLQAKVVKSLCQAKMDQEQTGPASWTLLALSSSACPSCM